MRVEKEDITQTELYRNSVLKISYFFKYCSAKKVQISFLVSISSDASREHLNTLRMPCEVHKGLTNG